MSDQPFDLRDIPWDDPVTWEMGAYAFGASPTTMSDDDRAGLESLRNAIILGAYGDDAPYAKAVVLPMQINVRGKVMEHGGISGVVTMPQARRKGAIRALMAEGFRRQHERGWSVSTLYPFREGFYERMGYTKWQDPLWAFVDPANIAAVLRIPKTGDVRLRRVSDAVDDWSAFLETYMARHHGFAIIDDRRRAFRAQRDEWWIATVHVEGDVTGAMFYRITGHHEAMVVWSFLADDLNARYQLLDWIARHVDQVKEARVRLAYGEAPELWVTDSHIHSSATGPESWLGPMGRVLALEHLGGIGASDGEVCLDVTDDSCPWNTGVWTLRGVNGKLEVTSSGTPQASVKIQALSDAVFVGSDPATYRWRGWGEVPADVARQLQSLFPPAAPFIHEEF